MRKNIFISALALMSAIAFTSCMKENFEQAGDSQKGSGVNITVNTGSPDLKSYIEYDEVAEKYLPKWHKGDALGAYFVNDSGANPASLTNANDNGTKASFTGTASLTEGNYTLYAVYPARAVQNVTADMVVGLEFPYIQFPSATSFDPKADILVNVPHDVTIAAEQTDVTVDDMRFRRVGSIVKVVLSDLTGNLTGDKIKSVYLESDMPGVALSGVFEYDYKTEEAAGMSVSKNHVTADLTRLETLPVLDGQNAVYMMLPPCTLKDDTYFTVKVKTDNYIVTKTLQFARDYDFPSSQVVTLNISLDDRCKFEKVYFEDNFDWLYYWWDSIAADDLLTSVDQVDDSKATTSQPNIYNYIAVEDDFKARGYVDLTPENKTIYMQENYLKFCKNNKQTALQLPQLKQLETPTNLNLSFKWAKQDNRTNIIVIVTGGGYCATSETEKSEVFSVSTAYTWQEINLPLVGITKDSKIVIQPNVESMTTSSYYRWYLDNVKITETKIEQSAEFPVKWSMKHQDDLTLGIDYLVGNINNGAYLYSDNHQGKLTVVRESETDCNPSTYLWRKTDNTTSGTLLHYGMSKDKYWLFEIYNVNNPAGTYNIQYEMTSSAGGPKYFVLEYYNGAAWVPFATNSEPEQIYIIKDGDETPYETLTYSYAISPENNVTNETCVVDKSFHLDAITSNLQIRARVASSLTVDRKGELKDNTGGSNRIYKNITISFKPDAE